MNKKICVYAICKNEEKNIEAWYESMKEADHIIVLDTGSTDRSIEIIKSLNIELHTYESNNFRFDEARNKCLEYVDEKYDICVCTDLDERFNEGWAETVRNLFSEDITRIAYIYNWSFDTEGKPSLTYYLNKIHKNKMYVWENAIHEVLVSKEDEHVIYTDDIVLNHYQDIKKDRSSYLKLLELSVKEDPNNDRNMHYLGREYMYYKEYNKCIDTLLKHLSLNSSTWKDERNASMRYIARSYLALNRINESKMWYELAIKEAPHLREAYVELANIYYDENNYEKVIEYLSLALKIKEKAKTYMTEEFSWNYHIYDLLANSYFYTNDLYKSFYYSYIASSLSNNERLKNNFEIIKNAIDKKI